VAVTWVLSNVLKDGGKTRLPEPKARGQT
jgi:hypothetical protein